MRVRSGDRTGATCSQGWRTWSGSANSQTASSARRAAWLRNQRGEFNLGSTPTVLIARCHFRRRVFLQVATTPDELDGRAATGHRQGVAEDDYGRVDPALPVGVIDFGEDITPTEGLVAGPKTVAVDVVPSGRTGGSPCPASSSVEHRGLGGARLIEFGISQV
jgi:hypothetical protein